MELIKHFSSLVGGLASPKDLKEKEKEKKDSSDSDDSDDVNMKDAKEEIKTEVLESPGTKVSKLGLKISVFQCLANICDKQETAREKVILDSTLMQEGFQAIKESEDEDQDNANKLNIAGCKFFTTLGRSDKAKKSIVHE